jgi:heme oxygenase
MSLKELTWAKHKDAERSAFARKLISGELTTYEYSLYLTQMCYVYGKLEEIATRFGLLDDLDGIYRRNKIWDDIVELAGSDNGLGYLKSTVEYYNYLDRLKSDPDGAKKILAHVYVRHMGDLYGGQMIAKKVPGQGRFYQFNDRDRLINTIRSKLSDDLADEANIAFDHAIAIMRELNVD